MDGLAEEASDLAVSAAPASEAAFWVERVLLRLAMPGSSPISEDGKMISSSEAMDERLRRLRALEGPAVGLALADGSRIVRGNLVSVASGGTVWLVVGGVDRFVALEDVIDCWEEQCASHASGSRRSRGEGGPRRIPWTHPRQRASRPRR